MIIYLIPDDYDPGDKFKLELDYSKINFKDIKHIKFIIYCIPESYLYINNMYKEYKNNYNAYLKVNNYYEPDEERPKIMKKPRKENILKCMIPLPKKNHKLF